MTDKENIITNLLENKLFKKVISKEYDWDEETQSIILWDRELASIGRIYFTKKGKFKKFENH